MKNQFFCIIFILCLFSCSKSIVEEHQTYPILNPKLADNDAGTWKPILISNPADIDCNIPLDVNSSEVQSQLAEIVQIQKNLSQEQRNKINYWGAGAVLRWNEILRDLVAKNNIPPYQNPDGSYPVPNPNNPFAYPSFPFSNPPYAARAYAYLSAAQYDAILVAYHYKNKYPRYHPSQLNNSITPYFNLSAKSSFPSEDAVVLSSSVEILKLLFPADVDFIMSKAEEHIQARKAGGGNIQEDMDAGKAIGKLVATKYINRAKTDGASTAGGNKLVWEKLKNETKARGEIPWISQETPARPPMLPLFGKVKPFLFESYEIPTNLRPHSPPLTGSNQFKVEMEEIYQITSNLTREQESIAAFWADGIQTYTPPGHWNYIASRDFVLEHYSEPRWARNLALLNMTLMDAAIVCWDAKYFYFNPRPMQVDSRIKTTVGLPNFPSYISGHSTFSSAAAKVLGHLIPSKASSYRTMAEEASNSRLYGGIHFRSDCQMGLITGEKVGNYAVERAKIDGAN